MSTRMVRTAESVLLLTLVSFLAPVPAAHAWKQSSGCGNTRGGTLGWGAVRILAPGSFTFSYSLTNDVDHIVTGAQLYVVNWDLIGNEPSYFKLRSEFFVASALAQDSLSISTTVPLSPGRYIFLYGPWDGITHDTPEYSGHAFDLQGPPGSFDVLSEWAGDVSHSSQSCVPQPAGVPGTIGKISAVWDTTVMQQFGVVGLFPDAKIVCKFGDASYPTACQVATVSVTTPPAARIGLSVSPNPSAGLQRVGFDLERAGNVRFHIFDAAGRQISTLIDRHLIAGTHTVYWDGRNTSGQRVAPGAYFYQLVVDGQARGSRGTVLID